MLHCFGHKESIIGVHKHISKCYRLLSNPIHLQHKCSVATNPRYIDFMDKPLQAFYKYTLSKKHKITPNSHRNTKPKVISRKSTCLFIWFSSCKLK